jgi:hypothetical protein
MLVVTAAQTRSLAPMARLIEDLAAARLVIAAMAGLTHS